jgi:hypothetical protein
VEERGAIVVYQAVLMVPQLFLPGAVACVGEGAISTADYRQSGLRRRVQHARAFLAAGIAPAICASWSPALTLGTVLFKEKGIGTGKACWPRAKAEARVRPQQPRHQLRRQRHPALQIIIFIQII